MQSLCSHLCRDLLTLQIAVHNPRCGLMQAIACTLAQHFAMPAFAPRCRAARWCAHAECILMHDEKLHAPQGALRTQCAFLHDVLRTVPHGYARLTICIGAICAVG